MKCITFYGMIGLFFSSPVKFNAENCFQAGSTLLELKPSLHISGIVFRPFYFYVPLQDCSRYVVLQLLANMALGGGVEIPISRTIHRLQELYFFQCLALEVKNDQDG